MSALWKAGARGLPFERRILGSDFLGLFGEGGEKLIGSRELSDLKFAEGGEAVDFGECVWDWEREFRVRMFLMVEYYFKS